MAGTRRQLRTTLGVQLRRILKPIERWPPGFHLPPLPPCLQLSVLSSLRQLTIDASPAVSRDGFSVLSTLTSVTRLVLHGAPAWPAVLQQLTGLRHLVSVAACVFWLACSRLP